MNKYILALTLLISAISAHADFAWTPDLIGRINCVETSDTGKYMHAADPNLCRQKFGYFVNFGHDNIGRVNCLEMTPSSQAVQMLDMNVCRVKFGVHYAWVSGNTRQVCAEVTPSGDVISAASTEELCMTSP